MNKNNFIFKIFNKNKKIFSIFNLKFSIFLFINNINIKIKKFYLYLNL